MKNWIVYPLATLALIWSLTRVDTNSRKSQATAAENKVTKAAGELAAPLLHRIFTSTTCLKDKDGFYRQSVAFSAEGTTTFTQNFFADAACKEPEPRENVREGSYALAKEEAGQLLLTVRHLDPATPYFEALIKVEKNRLTMESQLYTAL